jgi:hypothetical protein
VAEEVQVGHLLPPVECRFHLCAILSVLTFPDKLKKMSTLFRLAGLAVAGVIFAIAFSETAHAYIDPGSASLWLQGILATIAAVTATVSVTWRKIKDFFRRFMKS